MGCYPRVTSCEEGPESKREAEEPSPGDAARAPLGWRSTKNPSGSDGVRLVLQFRGVTGSHRTSEGISGIRPFSKGTG